MNRILLSSSLVLALGACAHERAPAAEEVLPTQRVQVAAARTAEHSTGEEVVGTVRARSVAALSASVMGSVRELSVSVGSKVKAGQVLVRLSAQEIEAKAEQARALLAQAELGLRRADELKGQSAIAPAQYEAVLAQHRVAAANVAEAEVMRGYTVLRAPFAGVVTAKQVEVGDLALPGKPLLVIENPDALRLEAAVPEATSGELAVGTRMPVRIDALGRELIATVSEQAPTADPVSRTVLVKLDLPSGETALRPGMFGRLLLKADKSLSITIPASALVRRGQLETVFVVRGEHGDRAELRLVRSGRSHGDSIELLSGLDAGELVVVSDADHLRDGQPIARM